ncbi:hypothetical protein B5X24_HaOG216810 [Helicoverpa armigera]|nr:hypothetical protein B5X24_HaOG216810 [Helicoverpa armigera]
MLNTKLNEFVTLHANQFGFRPGLSTESAVLCVKHTVAYYSERETPVYACFLDLSKAFDLVSYDVLWAKLDKLKVPTEIQNILKYWYGNQVNNVRWAGTLSHSYGLECGVRQGGLTSPTLFNLYMNELIEGLSSTRVGCFIDGVSVNNISYADDMVLLSASVCVLRRLIAQCEDYARTHGLIYNCSKSEIMVFESGGRSPDTIPVIKLNEKPLIRTYKFKYLGHILTPDLKDDADVERERRALSIRANMLVRRFARCSPAVKVTLFRAYCTTFYTCSLWARCTWKSYSALRVQYNNAFRMLLGLPRFCSASGMFADAHVDCFYATMRKRCASLSVTPGSAAALSGKVRVNDRIVAVDGVSLAGKSNQRAVDALKQSGNIVTLELERYLRGPKFEQLQQAIAAGESAATAAPPHNPFLHMHRPDSLASPEHDIPMAQLHNTISVESAVEEAGSSSPPAAPVVTRAQPAFEMPRTHEQKEAIRRKWQAILGDEVEIVVGVVVRGGGGLGISLEGTVDVEGGREVRPHHYVRSVLPEGPVGRAGVHRPGDELLEVNGHRLLGMNHLEVVSILKELSSEVCMVCARPRPAPPIDLAPPAATLVKAKSDGSLAGAGAEEGGSLSAGGKVRSRSLEPLTGLAMWSSEPQIIELVKGERGLGFSILDYQDPLRPSHTLVVIRSLVPGGVAQQDGRLIPGDRLLFVNDQNLEDASLEQAVAALKGAPRGVVRIGVAKPLPLADAPPPLPHTAPPTQP